VRDNRVDGDLGEAGLSQKTRKLATDAGVAALRPLGGHDCVDQLANECRLRLEHGRKRKVGVGDDQPPSRPQHALELR
jgi:hypothetical protein